MRCLPMRLAASATLIVLSAFPTFAASPQEDLVREWLEVTAMGLDVKVGGSSYNPATASVVLENVVFGGEGSWARIDFPVFVVTDPRKTAAGMFAAHAVRGENMKATLHIDPAAWFPELAKKIAETGGGAENSGPDQDEDGVDASVDVSAAYDVELTADLLLYERIETPLEPAKVAADADTITRVLAHARHSLAARADWFEMDNLRTVTRGLPEGESETSYELIFATGIHDGRIERSGYNNYRGTTTAGEFKQAFSAETSYMSGMDLGAVLAVLDPASVKAGKPDGRWRTVVQQQGIVNMSIEAEGVAVKLGLIELDVQQMRQTEKSVVEIFQAVFADPEAVEKDPLAFVSTILPNLTGLMRFNSLAIDNTEMTGPDGVAASLAELDISDIDGEGIGAITLRRGELTVDPQTSGKFNVVSLGNIRFGALKPLLELGAATEGGGEPPPELIRAALIDGMPRTDFAELNGLSINTPLGTFGLSALTVTGGDWLGSIARRGEFAWTALNFPVTAITDPSAKDELTAMGYEQISVSGGASWSWDTDKGIVRLDDATVTVADMGLVSFDAEVNGLPLSILDNPDLIEQRMQDVALVGSSFRFGNNSIVERTFEAQAKKLNQKPEDFRDNFANALPLMLGFLEDKTIQDRFAAVLKDFFKDPRSLVVTAKPAAPLPFTAIEALGNDGVGPLLDALKFKIVANQ
ncbi:hypothetical protein [Chthonobacter albigriseus]|uniref:hypothetical protein n=1 Tax=Chthonobacter albigriseus TaxID=1683161 RepID=UPI0015EEF04F|nr:hypothetical protein [Chthonobacter albigriseus]